MGVKAEISALKSRVKKVEAGGGAGVSNIVEDTTPQLGGNLDLNSFTVGAATADDLTSLHNLSSATDGDVPFINASGNLARSDGFHFISTTKQLKLVDKDYVPFEGALDADCLFSVGSNDNVQNNAGVIETSNHFVGAAVDLKIVASGADKWLFGQMTQFRMSGAVTGSPPIHGHWLQVCNRGLTGGTPPIQAGHFTVNLEGAASEAGGFVGEAYRGSNVACPVFFGVRGIAANGYATATEANAGDFYVQTVSTAATIALARSVWAHAELTAGHSVTNLRFLSADSVTSDAAIDNSVGLYLDTSIDLGTTTKYAIQSLSTSPSVFAGDVSGVINAYDGTWEDSPKFATEGALFAPLSVIADGDKGDISLSSSGTVWTVDNLVTSARTYYVCPSGQTVANYNGDGLNTAVTPSDANDGLTKATPLATISAAAAKISGKVLFAPVTIQLADTDATANDEVYYADEIEFNAVCVGGAPFASILEKALNAVDDTYPAAYIHIKGNLSTPNNVTITGASVYNGTTSATQCAFVARNTALRVEGVKMNYFRAANGDRGAITGYNSRLYIETINATSDHTGNDGSLVSGFFQSVIMLGGSFTITNSGFARANAQSILQTYSPKGYWSLAFSHSGASCAAIMVNEQSHAMVQGGTHSFTGAGAYYCFWAITNSSINFNNDATGTWTFNCAAAKLNVAMQRSVINEALSTASNPTTFTALGQRAFARNGAFISYNGTTAGSTADAADGGSFIANGTFPYTMSTASTFSPLTISATTVYPVDIVRTNTGQAQIRVTAGGNNAWESAVINAQRHRGTYASQSALSAGDDILTFNGAAWGTGSGSSATYNAAGTFYLEADGTTTNTSSPGRWKIGTTPSGTTSPVDRIVINNAGVTSLYKGADVASAGTIAATGNVFHVTGTTGISAISTTGITAGTEITIIFDASLTVTNGASLMLAGAANFSATADDVLVLIYDGTKWREKCRSVN